MNPAFRYKCEVVWSNEDECFMARVPALKAMGHGDTPGQAVDKAYVGAEGILDILMQDGQPIPPSECA